MDSPSPQAIKPYDTTEHGTVPVPLSELLIDGRLDIYEAVTRKNYLQVSIDGDRLRFRAGGYVGLIPINSRVVIDVRPRVPVRNLERIFSVSGQQLISIPLFARGYAVNDEALPALLDIFTDALLEALDRFHAMGLIKGYVPLQEETSFPTGRILMDHTIKTYRSRYVQHKVSTRRFEHTSDIPVNQCIKYTLFYLANTCNAMPDRKGRRARLRALNAAYHLFDQVTLDLHQRFFADPLVNGTGLLPGDRSYYRNPLRLCAAILRNQGLALLKSGDIELPHFVINMEKVFESFLLAALVDRLSSSNATLRVLDGNRKGPGGGEKPLFDDADVPEAKPDVVIQRRDRTQSTPVVIDAKYKPAHKREDINQAVTYGASFRANHVILALPKTEDRDRGLEPIGTIDRLKIYIYRFDLSAEDLDEEIDCFADRVGDLAAMSPRDG